MKPVLPARLLYDWLTTVEKKIGWLTCLTACLACLTTGAFSQTNINFCDPAPRSPLIVEGGFELDNTTICVGTTVTVVSVDPNVLSDSYFQNYNGKGLPPAIARTRSFTYAQPGSYTIIQNGSKNGTGAVACRSVTVLPRDAVPFTPVMCSGRRVSVDIKLDGTAGRYDYYIIQWGADGRIDVKTKVEITAQKPAYTYSQSSTNTPTIAVYGIYGTPTNISCEGPTTTQKATLSGPAGAAPAVTRLTTTGNNGISIQYQGQTGVAVELYQKDASGIYKPTSQTGIGTGIFAVQADTKQVQCFRVVVQDACSTDGPRSDEVCSLVLNANAINKRNDLTWKPYDGTVSGATSFRRYRVFRNNAPLVTLFDRNIGNHADVSRVECNEPYCYTLEATVSGSVETVVTSNSVCVTGINGDVPGDFGSILVSVENNRPRLVAALPATGTTSSYTIAISRSDGPSGTFQPLGTVVSKNTFVDETADPSTGSYCYRLTYVANCGLSSPPSPPVCAVLLGSKSNASIDWTAASPFAPGSVANYVIEVVDSSGLVTREIPVGKNLRYEPDLDDPTLQSQRFRIIAVSDNGFRSASNLYVLRREARILIPDAFSPNGDGTNDVFTAKGSYADLFRMTIYDRWGGVIYATTDRAKGWDGTADGPPAAVGQYTYRIDVQNAAGVKTVRTGVVLLIR